MKNIQDIIPDREIIKMKNSEFEGIEYESWNVGLPIFSDQMERLLENGFMVSVLDKGFVHVDKQLTPSPTNLRENKEFWNEFRKTVGVSS